ncbi:MAG: bacteriohemerythrin [Negativicutes bacterium]|nr:bacteriohemerythrin [Negativicutes bacterium]
MAYMKWDPTLLTGIQELDVQHQTLFSLVNDIYDEIPKCPTTAAEGVFTGRFLSELGEYANSHFAKEETILLECSYPRLAEHQGEHENFRQALHKLQFRHDAGEPALAFEIFTFASEWLVHHLQEADRDYLAYLK